VAALIGAGRPVVVIAGGPLPDDVRAWLPPGSLADDAAPTISRSTTPSTLGGSSAGGLGTQAKKGLPSQSSRDEFWISHDELDVEAFRYASEAEGGSAFMGALFAGFANPLGGVPPFEWVENIDDLTVECITGGELAEWVRMLGSYSTGSIEGLSPDLDQRNTWEVDATYGWSFVTFLSPLDRDEGCVRLGWVRRDGVRYLHVASHVADIDPQRLDRLIPEPEKTRTGFSPVINPGLVRSTSRWIVQKLESAYLYYVPLVPDGVSDPDGYRRQMFMEAFTSMGQPVDGPFTDPDWLAEPVIVSTAGNPVAFPGNGARRVAGLVHSIDGIPEQHLFVGWEFSVNDAQPSPAMIIYGHRALLAARDLATSEDLYRELHAMPPGDV